MQIRDSKQCDGVLLMALLLVSGSVWAQQPPNPRPDAGTVLRQFEIRPTDVPMRRGVPTDIPEAPKGPAFEDSEVRVLPSKFRLSGVSLVKEEELQKLLAPLVGKPSGFSQLQYAADLITAFYRSKGYITSRAYLPQQTLSAAGDPTEVELIVLEGRYGKVRVENKSRIREDVLRGILPVKEGDAVQLAPVERGLLLIEDLPGARVVSSTFGPGDKVGESEYIAAIGDEPAVTGQVFADNFGLRVTGRLRGGVQAIWQSPRSVGDALEGNVITSGQGQATGRVAYTLPLGSNGLRATASLSRVSYRLGKEFDGLDYKGTADVTGVSLSHPLVRERSLNVTMTMGLESKSLDDTNEKGQAKKHTDLLSFGLNGDEVDGFSGGGTTAWSYIASFGKLRLRNDVARAFDTNKAEGSFSRYNIQVSRLQMLDHLSRGLSFQLVLRTQYAPKNLESSEKMSLGGPTAVRAYPQGEAAGDRAWLANLELRQRFNWISGWTNWVSAFYDAGGAKLAVDPVPGDLNRRLLRGYGLGFGGDYNSRYYFSGVVSQPIGETSFDPSESTKSYRAWLQLGMNY